jgi:hypothetical protein
VFNISESSARFPIFFNGHPILTMKNHTRFIYKLFTEGPIQIYRKSGSTIGPQSVIYAEHGKYYGIKVSVNTDISQNSANKFSMKVYDNKDDFDKFLSNEYFSLEPFVGFDFYFVEEKGDKLVK